MTAAQRQVGDPSLAAADDVMAACQTDLAIFAIGLTAAEAARRLAGDGANQLRAAAQASAWRRALGSLHDPLVVLLPGAVTALCGVSQQRALVQRVAQMGFAPCRLQ